MALRHTHSSSSSDHSLFHTSLQIGQGVPAFALSVGTLTHFFLYASIFSGGKVEDVSSFAACLLGEDGPASDEPPASLIHSYPSSSSVLLHLPCRELKQTSARGSHLLCAPRPSVSRSFRLRRKCQSICACILVSPSANRIPHCLHLCGK